MSITLFQTKFNAPIKKNNKSLHQQSLLLNDNDSTSDDEENIYIYVYIYPNSKTRLIFYYMIKMKLTQI